MMRVFGYLGLLAAIVIVLILMVKAGQSMSGVENGSSQAKTGSQKAYDDLKKDGDMDDPKDAMRGALKGDF